RLANDGDRDVDLNLLALLHDEEVDVLDDLAYRVLLDILDERELRAAFDVELEQRVGAADDERDLVARKCTVHGLGAVAVDDGGDLASSAQAAGEALAELVANLSVDLGVLRHKFSFGARDESLAAWWSNGQILGRRRTKKH